MSDYSELENVKPDELYNNGEMIMFIVKEFCAFLEKKPDKPLDFDPSKNRRIM